jgi:uncharacterized protein YabE (DUF348 family)
MNRKIKLVLLIAVPLIGILAGYYLMGRDIPLVVNGEQTEVFTHALTVRGALRSAGYTLTSDDRVTPEAGSWLSRTTQIRLDQARQVRVWIDPQGKLVEITSAAKTPGELLTEAGIVLSTGDTVLVDGRAIGIDEELADLNTVTLQYEPATQISVKQQDGDQNVTTSTGWLGMALWQAGYRLNSTQVAFDLFQPVESGLEVTLPESRAVTITVDGGKIDLNVSADNVGEALARAGISLQDLDYSVPGERKPVPDDGRIKVVRVREEMVFEQSSIPFEVQSTPDDSMDITQTVVDQEGVPGVKASRVRVRYEDGVEVSRTNESEMVLVEPVPRISRYGTRLVENVVMTEEGPRTYYLAVEVTATAYSPCRLGVPGCGYTTALGLPVQKGIIAVHIEWYRIFKGTQMYVPGYGIGTIADTGYYPYNHYWVDLGYSDDDFVGWGAIPTTVYFLSPPPSGFTGVLP